MKFQRLKGTEDIFGPEALLFEHVEATARQVFRTFGFEEIRTPCLESKKLFQHALGDATDVVQKEMYEFVDKSEEAVALRPEGTASVVRAYLENSLDKTEGVSKLFYIGPMFRRERPQKGRLRQFHQLGVETLGLGSPYADAETILCLVEFLNRLGVSGWNLKLNNLGTFEERRHFKEELEKYFKPLKKELCEDCRRRLEKNVLRILDCKNEHCRKIVLKSPPLGQFLIQESRDHYAAACHALDSAGIPYVHDEYMVRGLDYYTRTVFELTHPSLGSQDALAAGGRYDTLVESFGGPKAGAVGFALGVERLLICLGHGDDSGRGTARRAPTTIFIATLGGEAFKKGFELLSGLRKAGTRALMDFSSKSLKGQMRAADKEKCRTVVILGDDELKKGVLMLKDMTDGSQKEIALKDALKILCSEPTPAAN